MKYAKLGLKTSIKDNFGARMRILARLRQERNIIYKISIGPSPIGPIGPMGEGET